MSLCVLLCCNNLLTVYCLSPAISFPALSQNWYLCRSCRPWPSWGMNRQAGLPQFPGLPRAPDSPWGGEGKGLQQPLLLLLLLPLSPLPIWSLVSPQPSGSSDCPEANQANCPASCSCGPEPLSGVLVLDHKCPHGLSLQGISSAHLLLKSAVLRISRRRL